MKRSPQSIQRPSCLFSNVTTRLGLDGSLPNRSIQLAQSPSKGLLLPCTLTCRLIGVSAYLARVAFPSEKSKRLRLRGQYLAFFYASAFFQLDDVPPPAPARVHKPLGAGLAVDKRNVK
jgi:hypothetical protein